MFRTLARNVAWNWIGFVVFAGLTFFLTPFVLAQLGEVRYAIWALAASFTGYYGLIDLGLRSGINQYLTRYLAQGDMESVNQTASTVFFALAGIASLVFAISLLCGFLVPRFVDSPEIVTDREIFWCVTLIGSSVALEFLLFPFMCLLMAKQRYDLANVGSIIARVATAAGIYFVLNSGHGLVAIAAVSFGGNLLEYTLRSLLGFSLVPALRISTGLVRLKRAKEVASFGAWTFLINASQTVLLHTTPLVILGSSLEITAITYYSLASRLGAYLNDFLNNVGRVFFPAATDLHAKSDHAGLQQLYLGGTRSVLLICAVLGTVGWFWANDFYRLWVGDELSDPTKVSEVAALFQILLIAVIGGHIPNIGRQVLLGVKHVKPLAIFTVLEAATNLVLLFWLIEIPWIGIKGAAFAQVIPMYFIRSIAVPILVGKEIDLSIVKFLQTFVRPMAVFAVLASGMLWLSSAFHPTNWLELVLIGCASAAIALAAVGAVGLTGDERKRFWDAGHKRLTSSSAAC